MKQRVVCDLEASAELGADVTFRRCGVILSFSMYDYPIVYILK